MTDLGHPVATVEVPGLPSPELLARVKLITRLSHSAEGSVARCGEQYRLNYIERIPDEKGYALVLGSAVDAAVTYAGLEQIKKARPPLATVLEFATDQAPKIWEDTEKKSAGPIKCKDDESKEGFSAEVRAMVEAYERVIGVDDRPVLVQHDFQIQVAGAGAAMTGRLDLYDESFRVRDLKTSKQSKQESEAMASPQLIKYQMAVRYGEHRPVAGRGLDVLVRLKGGVKVQKLYVPPATEAEENAMLLVWAQRLLQVRSGIFPKTDDYDVCANFCGYLKICKPEWYAYKQRAAEAKKEKTS